MELEIIKTRTAELKASWINVAVKNNLSAWKFLIDSLDALINFVEVKFQIPGSDKKQIVINAINDLYDYVIASNLPILLKPFSGIIKKYFINVILSILIDYFVSKYNDGSWTKLAVA